YKKRVMNKMKIKQERMDEVLAMAKGESPMAILRRIREMDKEEA
ncbi:MAG: response regulator, partial [Candidatus Abyssobacteria bacterium SURF_17]